MADDGTIIEKPTKAKRTRPKSAKSKEDIPLADMGESSDLKFNQLLQQAVGQSISDAKAVKKTKKKKTAESVLESLRKGEGIQKETDSTVIANTFDPDLSKYEKSNKKKQKRIEDMNLKNELEIQDETQSKVKKKKKPKFDEKIENVHISELLAHDKTMTLDELDGSVQKAPAVKKKRQKPKEEEPTTSARSEEDQSRSEPPKPETRKKKKKPVVEEEIQTESARTEESVPPTPTKRKTKKPVIQEEEPESSRPDTSVLTPTKKKKKPKVEGEVGTEDDAMSPSEDLPSPKGKKKKKKKDVISAQEAEEEALLAEMEKPVSPKGKKTKKKKTEEELEQEALIAEIERAASPKGRKPRKKKAEGETEDEALSPSEDVASPKGKGKRRVKKKKPETEEEGEEDTEPKSEDAPKAKPRRKKKKATEEETEEGEEAEDEAGREVEDEGRILAVTIHRTDKLKNDFYIMHPMIRVHVIDQDTGHYLPKQHTDRAVTSYYEIENEHVKHVLPIMTKPFDFKQQKSVLPVWEELLIFNENYNYFIQDKPKVIIFFELLDFVSMNRTAQNDGHDKGWHRIAWAFLKVVGNNKKINSGSKVRLQLFEVPSHRPRPDTIEIFQWWQMGNRKPYTSTLYVTLKGIQPPPVVEPAERSLFATQEEKGKMTYSDLKKSINWGGKKESTQRILSSWSRLAGQLCRLPNHLAMALPSAKKGCFIVRFSHDGRSLACACHGKEGYPILVYEIPSGALRGKFMGHFGIVYDMCWSKMDTHLLTSSSDGTARVWDLQQFGEQADKLLPHPAFVYCSQFHPRVDNVAVTGGYDQVIRIWDVGEDQLQPILKQELEDHVGYVNTVCFSDDGQKMYSADSVGVIIIWNSFFTEQPSKRGIARDWTLFQKIEDPEIKGTVINYLSLHPSGRRLLVHSRDNMIRMFDLRIQRVMQKYIGALNFREQIRSAVTPCGSFVFSGSEDNFAYAWNTDTGDQVLMYSELNYQNPVTDVHYHPREHMVVFCSLGENHPILIYNYDTTIAQYDAGLSPRQISPVPFEDPLGSPRLTAELTQQGVLTKDEFQAHTLQRHDKVMRTLNKVTSQMVGTPTLDLPGMTGTSPRPGSRGMVTMGTGYDYGTTPRSMMGSPTHFSPHAPRTMQSVMQHKQFESQNLYMKGVETWRPTFSEVGRHGTRSTSPVLGRAPQLNLTASTVSGKAQFNFQAPPGKAVPKYENAVVLYDYRAQRSDELNLFAGDEVRILYKDTENWWMGELADGQQGFFPANYVTEEETLMESHRSNLVSPDASDVEKSRSVTAVRTKTGELKFISGAEESEDDVLESTRTRRRKKRDSQDTVSDTNQSGKGKKPPRKSGQRVNFNETSESIA